MHTHSLSILFLYICRCVLCFLLQYLTIYLHVSVGVIKDMIISGDPALKYALDKYEKGDFTEIDAIIKRGKMTRKQSIDLLEVSVKPEEFICFSFFHVSVQIVPSTTFMFPPILFLKKMFGNYQGLDFDFLNVNKFLSDGSSGSSFDDLFGEGGEFDPYGYSVCLIA